MITKSDKVELAIVQPKGLFGAWKSYFQEPLLVPKPNDDKKYDRQLGRDNMPYWVEVK